MPLVALEGKSVHGGRGEAAGDHSMENNNSSTIQGKNQAKPDWIDRQNFWNGRAREFSEHAASTGYPAAFLRIMKPRKSWTVLDMACGGGTLAIPLARKVKAITAVDFSERMLEIVEQRCCTGGIANVKTLLGRWEDDWDRLGIGVHDVAIASRSLLSEDDGGSIAKLDRIAEKAVYISTQVGDGPFDRKLLESVGREFKQRPDYIFYVNLLYEMGIRANVTFISESNPNSWESPEEAFEDQRWMLQGMTDEEEEKLRTYLGQCLVRVKGRWRLPYSRNYCWAVLYWTKNGRGKG